MMKVIADPEFRMTFIFVVIIVFAVVGCVFFHWRLKNEMREIEKYESPFMPREPRKK